MTWVQRGQDIDAEAAGDEAGFAVSIDSIGQTIAIGAYKNDGNGSNAGHTRVYKWNGMNWIQYGADIDGEHNDNYGGYAVNLNPKGTVLAIGAIRNDGNTTYSGQVRVYSSCPNVITSTDVQTACNSYTWLDGNTYTSSNNSATITLTNAAGCDSVVTLDLTINNATTGVDVQTACDSYTWLDGNTYTSSNNSATITLTNAVGCDSIVTLDLTINTVNINTTLTGLTISADAVGATYQWLDCNNNFAVLPMATNQSFTPAQNGDYAVVVTENSCVDTSACVSVTAIAVNTLADKDAIKVYPNPTQQTIYIDLGEIEAVSIDVYSADGKLVQQELTIQGNLHQIELPKTAGVYLLKITTSQGNSYHKVIRE